jgi:hypothetical protein
MAQGRRVRRVIRRIDTWSVLKVSSLFFATFMLVLLIAGVLLWIAGSVFGAVTGFERFMQAVGFEGFSFVGWQLLRGFFAGGVVIVLLGTGLSVLVAVVYNHISDMVGGIQLVVLEEDTRLVAPSTNGSLAVEDGGYPDPTASRPRGYSSVG